MKPISRNQVLDTLHWRYAVKQFDPRRKISAADWAALEEVLTLTPSGLNLQPWNFIVVDDPAVRAKLLAASYGQPQIADASHLVVFAAKTVFSAADVDTVVARTAEVRGIPVESLAGLRSMALNSVVHGLDADARRAWAANQTYIAVGALVTAAALLGIDTCPMEGFEHCRYDDLLGLESRGLTSLAVVALGYRDPTDKHAAYPKVRLLGAQVIRHV